MNKALVKLQEAFDSKSFDKSIKSLEDYHLNLISRLEEVLEDRGEKYFIDVNKIVRLTNAIAKNSQIIHASLFERRRLEGKEDIDLNHPKIQKAIFFLYEEVLEVLEDVIKDKALYGNVRNHLFMKLSGFEDRVNVALKGVSGAMLDGLKNPLLRENANCADFGCEVIDVNCEEKDE